MVGHAFSRLIGASVAAVTMLCSAEAALSASGGVNFTPDMQILLQAQFDNISRRFGLSVRVL